MSTGRVLKDVVSRLDDAKSDAATFAELADELADRLARLGHRAGQARAQVARELARKFRTWASREPTPAERDLAVEMLRDLHVTAIDLEKGSR